MIKIKEEREGTCQEWIFAWAGFSVGKYPELALLFHVPNEGKRTSYSGAALKRQGLKRGVPDMVLPVARGSYHGLYIELKVNKNRATKEQLWWIEALKQQGYYAVLCHGFEEAIKTIEDYLKSS